MEETTGKFRKPLGQRALEKGWITPEQRQACLMIQEEQLPWCLLGTIFAVTDVLSPKQVETLVQEIEVEKGIGCVIMLDTVGFSKKNPEQKKVINHIMNRLVQRSPSLLALEGRHFAKSTGDGLLLVFYGSTQELLDTAFGLLLELKDFNAVASEQWRFDVRTGLNVEEEPGDIKFTRLGEAIVDVHGRGVDLCERIMSAGDAGHITASAALFRRLLPGQEAPQGRSERLKKLANRLFGRKG